MVALETVKRTKYIKKIPLFEDGCPQCGAAFDEPCAAGEDEECYYSSSNDGSKNDDDEC